MVRWTNGDMTGERNNPTRLNHGDGEKVSCSRATATNKVSSSFLPNFSPVISNQYLFIFVKLEEDNICLFYNFPFGQTRRYVLRSLATVKIALVCMDKFVAIVLTSLTTMITRFFSILESLKRDGKETPAFLFRNVIP